MKQVLIIDDSDMIRSIARMIFERLDFEVIEASSGQLALQLCRQNRPDVILVDWLIRGMSGVDFLNTYSMQLIGKKPLIIYSVTEYIDTNVNQAIHAGADTYLLKPYDMAAVKQTLSAAAEAELMS